MARYHFTATRWLGTEGKAPPGRGECEDGGVQGVFESNKSPCFRAVGAYTTLHVQGLLLALEDVALSGSRSVSLL